MNEANEMEGSKSSGKSAQMPAKYAPLRIEAMRAGGSERRSD